MSASSLLCFITKLSDTAEAYRTWHAKQMIAAAVILEMQARHTGNRRVGKQDASDAVHDAYELLRAAAAAEAGVPLEASEPIRADEATKLFNFYIRTACRRMHQRTRPTRSKYRHLLPWPNPNEPAEATQLEEVAEREIFERSEAEAKKLIGKTKINPNEGVGKYALKLGFFASRGMNTSEISKSLNKSENNIHQYRTRVEENIKKHLTDALDPSSSRSKPKV